MHFDDPDNLDAAFAALDDFLERGHMWVFGLATCIYCGHVYDPEESICLGV